MGKNLFITTANETENKTKVLYNYSSFAHPNTL